MTLFHDMELSGLKVAVVCMRDLDCTAISFRLVFIFLRCLDVDLSLARSDKLKSKCGVCVPYGLYEHDLEERA